MSVVALPRRTPAGGVAPLPMDRLERVWAWGRADSAMSWVWRPTTVDGVRDVMALAAARGLGVGLRGAGCSYGDASLNAEGVSLGPEPDESDPRAGSSDGRHPGRARRHDPPALAVRSRRRLVAAGGDRHHGDHAGWRRRHERPRQERVEARPHRRAPPQRRSPAGVGRGRALLARRAARAVPRRHRRIRHARLLHQPRAPARSASTPA